MNRKHVTTLIGICTATAVLLLSSVAVAAAAEPATTTLRATAAVHPAFAGHHASAGHLATSGHHVSSGRRASVRRHLSARLGTLVPVAVNSDHVATSPNGRYAYVASATQNMVTVVDLYTGKVVKVIRVGNAPVDVAFDSSGLHAFVSNVQDGTVSMINTQTMAVTKTLKVGTADDWINSIAVTQTSTGVEIYVAAQHNSYLRTMNVATGKTGTIKATQYPGSVVIAGGKLVVAQSDGPGKVDIIDLKTGKLIRQLTTPENSNVTDATAIPGSHTVVLTGDAETSWLDLDTNTFTATMPAAAPGNLTGVAASPNGAYTYIATAGFPDASKPADGTITVVSNSTHKVVKAVTVGQFPFSIAATATAVVVPDAPTTGQNYLQIIPATDLT